MHSPGWRSKWVLPKVEHGIPTRWNWVVLYPENLQLGNFVDVGAFTLIMAKSGVVIEDDVEIGSHCAIYSESSIDQTVGKVFIQRGAKIGSHTTIMPGVGIGVNAVVGAHSFVKAFTWIGPGEVGFGVPYKRKGP